MPQDQDKDNTAEGTQQEQAPAQKSEETKGPKFPEGDPFDGDKMEKWVEESRALKEQTDQKPESKVAEEVKAETKPCKTCGDKKDERVPLKTFKARGKEIPVYTQEELDELAQKGADYTYMRQQDALKEKELAGKERDLLDREARLNAILAMPKTDQKKTSEAELDKVLEEKVLDPEMREVVKGMMTEIQSLKADLGEARQVTQRSQIETAARQLEELVAHTRQEFPFEDVLDESGENVTQRLYAGLVSSIANDENLKLRQNQGYTPMPIQDVVMEASRIMHHIQQHFRGNGSAAAAPVIDSKFLRENHPQVVEEISQAAVSAYLTKQAGLPPNVSGRQGDATASIKDKADDGEFQGIDDAFERAMKSPKMAQMAAEVQGRYHRAGK